MNRLMLFVYLLILINACNKDNSPKIVNEQVLEVSFRPEKVLFIGNSHTQNNAGLDLHIRNFLENTSLDYSPVVEKMTVGGYSIEDHLNDPKTISKLNEKDWDIVVLQENTSVAVNDKLKAQVAIQDFGFQIKHEKTKLFLFMTWEYEDDPGSFNAIKAMYEGVAPLVEATVVPVGLAFRNIRQDSESKVDLYHIDGVHTTMEGTLLTASMFYLAIYDKDPSQNPYAAGLDEETADYLKETAKLVMSGYDQ